MKNKHKVLYFNTILILLLFLVGFSPQIRGPIFNAYATGTTNSNTMDTSTFNSTISGYLGHENGTLKGENIQSINNDVNKALGRLKYYVDRIAGGAAVAANALVVLAIAYTGFKFIQTSRENKGSIGQFLKNKKEIANLLLAASFIFFIPNITKGIDDLIINGVFYNQDVTVNNTALSDIMTVPSSMMKDEIKKHATEATEQESLLNSDKYKDDDINASSIIKTMIEGVINIIAHIIYKPLKIFVTSLGMYSFYPMSFDPGMYTKEISTAIGKTLQDSLFEESIAADLGTVVDVINVLYYVVKKFCMTGITLICYYFGIKVLMGLDSTEVSTFLKGLFKGMFGMLLAPHLIEFMLDVDGLISTAILSVIGSVTPGMGILNLLAPTNEVAQSGTTLIFGLAMIVVVVLMAKTFFIRKVEIMFYYMFSPIIFFKYMMSPNKSTIKPWFAQLSSAIFITTCYAPIFAIVQLFMRYGSDVSIVLIIAILWFGHTVAEGIVASFAGGSLTAKKASQGFNSVKTAIPAAAMGAATGMALLGTGGVKAVKKTYSSIKENGFKNTVKDFALSGKDKFIDGVGNMKGIAVNTIGAKWYESINKLQDNSLAGKAAKAEIRREQAWAKVKRFEDDMDARKTRKKNESLRAGGTRPDGDVIIDLKRENYLMDKYGRDIGIAVAKDVRRLEQEEESIKDKHKEYGEKLSDFEDITKDETKFKADHPGLGDNEINLIKNTVILQNENEVLIAGIKQDFESGNMEGVVDKMAKLKANEDAIALSIPNIQKIEETFNANTKAQKAYELFKNDLNNDEEYINSKIAIDEKQNIVNNANISLKSYINTDSAAVSESEKVLATAQINWDAAKIKLKNAEKQLTTIENTKFDSKVHSNITEDEFNKNREASIATQNKEIEKLSKLEANYKAQYDSAKNVNKNATETYNDKIKELQGKVVTATQELESLKQEHQDKHGEKESKLATLQDTAKKCANDYNKAVLNAPTVEKVIKYQEEKEVENKNDYRETALGKALDPNVTKIEKPNDFNKVLGDFYTKRQEAVLQTQNPIEFMRRTGAFDPENHNHE